MDALALAEREKYRQIWAFPEYREWSPGADCAEDAIAIFGASSVIDFGCGDGKALDIFAAAGMGATGVGLVALREGVVEASLWDLPHLLPMASWGFCADVLEHLPTEKVDAVIEGIASKVRLGCYFRVSTVPDGMGRLVGAVLHLTVRPAGWWANMVDRDFAQVDVVSGDGFCTIVARK